MHCFTAIILEAKSALVQTFALFACFMIQYHILDVGGSPHMPGLHSSSLHLLPRARATLYSPEEHPEGSNLSG